MIQETKVCVIGSGPAGSTLARKLAMLGHDVVLVERRPFPRRHVGESLSPGILPLLEEIGVRDRFEAAPWMASSAAMVLWRGESERMDWGPGPPGFQVDRGQFDALLLEAARAAGARVMQPAELHGPLARTSGGWRVGLKHYGSQVQIQSCFLVDASGRHGVIPGRKRRTSAPTLALYAYWRTTKATGAAIRVEATRSEWFWGAALPDGTFNAMVFLDPSRCAGLGRADLRDLYQRLVAQPALFRGCLIGEPLSCLFAQDATCLVDEETAGEDWLKVGEASFTIDPLSSQGVQAAIRSGLQGAIVVHTALTDSINRAIAIQFHRERQRETVEQHKAMAATLYAQAGESRDHPFWHARSQTRRASPDPAPISPKVLSRAFDSPISVSPAAKLVSMPCIEGDLIRSKLALQHPGLRRPVAYLDGVELAPLLAGVSRGATLRQILDRWSEQIPPHKALAAARWLHRAAILVEDTTASPCLGSNLIP